MNAGIQGLAADIFKVALCASTSRSRRAAWPAASSSSPRRGHRRGGGGGGGRGERLTEEALTGAADLKVPLTISMGFGPSWRRKG